MRGDAAMLAEWENLHDPSADASSGALTTIGVSERSWRHFVEKHVCDGSEPWADVFGEETVKKLAAAPHGPFTDGPGAGASKAALAILGNEVRRSLSRPLVLIYTSLRERGIDGQRWVMPLPCGAIAIVNVRLTEKKFLTCYFTGAAGVNPIGTPNPAFKKRRWKIAVRQLVEEHAVFNTTTRRHTLPEARHRHEKSVKGGQREMCLNVHFVAPEVWGFTGNTPGSEWAVPTWTWD